MAQTPAHPGLQHRFFAEVSTRTIAYWLGFLYADGAITHARGRSRVSLSLKVADEDLVVRFAQAVGADPGKRWYRTNRVHGARTVVLQIDSARMVRDLVRLGCHPRKSRSIRLPDSFGDRALDLAFLMGVFDGDGNACDTTLNSGSRSFLEDIRRAYGLRYPIRLYEDDRGRVYRMTLGAPLFREMMEAFPESLPRKRQTHMYTPVAPEDRVDQRRFVVTAEDLRKLVWAMPTSQVAQMFGVSDKAVEKRCKALDVDKPPRGYWRKVQTGFIAR